MKFTAMALMAALVSSVSVGHDEGPHMKWTKLDTRLPKPLSDHAVSLVDNRLVFISGGCDSPDGNRYIEISKTESVFVCGSISASFYSFNVDNKTFSVLADMPRSRYRHSSAYVNNQIWLVGGRDLDDNLIAEVDVYDIGSQTWASATLPEKYRVSDHAVFAPKSDYVYIAGGYNSSYAAQSMVNRILVSSLTQDALVIEEEPHLAVARGDIFGDTSPDGARAFVGGGFTDQNGFCEPLGSVEQYVFAEEKWVSLPDLEYPRGEIVLLEFDDHLFALGGERQIEGICERNTSSIEPGYLTVALKMVEELSYDGTSWKVASDFPDHKFRFDAVAVDGKGIYTFGGQTVYNTDCECFKTTDEVLFFGEDSSSASFSGAHRLYIIMLGFCVVTLLMI